MLHEHAQFEDGGVSVEAGLIKMLTMMQSRPLQGIQAFKRLVGGISALSPQGGKGGPASVACVQTYFTFGYSIGRRNLS